MNTRLRKPLSLLLTLAMVLTMCSGFSSASFASSKEVQTKGDSGTQSNLTTSQANGTDSCTDSGDGTQDSPYIISTAAQMDDLATQVASGFSFDGKYFKLANNIDLSEYTELVIGVPGSSSGSANKPFKGTFDGDGNKITLNIVGKEDSAQIGLFGYATGATIENLTVDGTVAGEYYVGSIIGYGNSITVKNCTSEATLYSDHGSSGILGSGGIVGGLIGSDSQIINCTNKGEIKPLFTSETGVSYTSFGGIVGVAFGSSKNVLISGCKNEGKIEDMPCAAGVGGICGKVISADVTFEDCINTADLSAVGTSSNSANGIGGICGYFSGYKNQTSITRCSNTASISGREANYAYTGGICGQSAAGYSIEECVNTGSVSAAGGSVGGICGQASGNVISSYNTGSVINTKQYPTSSYYAVAGGVIGNQVSKDTSVKNCYNIGTVSCSASNEYAFSGGVIGELLATSIDSKLISANRYLADSAACGIGGIDQDDEACKSFEANEKTQLLNTIGKAYQKDTEPNINGGYPILRWQNSEATYAVSFNVKDKETNASLRDAKIEIDGVSAQEEDGSFELTPGTYNYSVSRNGYTAVSDTFTINKKSLDFDIELTSIKHEYTIKVKPADANLTITNDNGAPAVAKPDATIDEANNIATYVYVLADKGAYGAYNLDLSCYTYNKQSLEIEATGTNDKTEVSMTALPTKSFTVNVEPKNATVYVTNVEYGQQSQALSKDDGVWKFNLIDGDYNYKVKASGYGAASGSFTIPDDTQIAVSLEERPTWDGISTDTDWYTWHPFTDEYTISEPEELAGLAKLVNDGTQDFSGKTINLAADIDLGGNAQTETNSWTSIGNMNKVFKGTFNGDGHAIKNLYIGLKGYAASADGYKGLFGQLDSANINNLKIQNISIKPIASMSDSAYYNYVGALAGAALNTTISNVETSGTINTQARAAYTGGICGSFNGEISDCVSNVDISSGYHVGGIVGTTYSLYANEASLILRCVNKGKINSQITGTTQTYSAGGIAGYISKASDTIKYCVNYGDVSGSAQSIGGVLGCTSSSYKSIELDSCYNLGNVTGTSSTSSVGGVVGFAYVQSQNPLIHNCYSAGTLSGGAAIGGIIGVQNYAKIDSSYFYRNFYLAADGYSGSNTIDGDPIDDEAFKEFEKSSSSDYSSLIDKLGIAYGPDVKQDDAFVYNGGYPILRWQNPDSKFQVKFDVSYDNSSNVSSEHPLEIVVKNAKDEVVYNGSATTCELEKGTYSYTVVRKGYAQVGGEFIVDRDSVVKDVSLVAQKYNLVINVDESVTFSLERVDEDTNTPIDNPEYAQASGSQTLGSYTFELVNGTYAYSAKKFGYAKETGTIEISYADNSKEINLEALDAESVSFNVEPAEGAFAGTDPSISIYSKGGDFDGTLLKTYDSTSQIFSGLYFPEGDYTYKIKAEGFATTQGEFSVEKGSPVKINETLSVKTQWDGSEDVDTDWYEDNKEASTYTLTNESQLAGLAKLVNDGTTTFADKTILLDRDMNFSNNAWTPIGGWSANGSKMFSGNFDGQGHNLVFKNAQMNASEATFGFFGYMSQASVSNLVLQGNAKVNYTDESASFLLAYAGSLAGYAYKSQITNCSNQMTFDITLVNEAGTVGLNCGGLVGWSVGTSYESCNNIAQIKADATGNGVTNCYVGGIAGFSNCSGEFVQGSINNCYNTGKITSSATSSNDGSANAYAAGIFASLLGNSVYCSMTNCYSAADVSAEGKSAKAGALIASLSNDGVFSNNYYLDNGLKEVSTGSAKRTEARMKGASFVDELNAGGSAYAINNNGGYPILSWEKSIDHIKVTTAPDKLEYNDLDDFDDAGMKITAYTSIDDSEAKEVNSGWTILDGKKMPFGQDSVTVEYKGATVKLPITIKQVVHKISSSDLEFSITAPKAGQTPQANISLNTSQAEMFSAKLVWTHAGNEFSGTFDEASFYRAHVSLTSKYEKGVVYYSFDRGAMPSVDGSFEIRNYKQTANEDSEYVTTEFDVTFKASANENTAINDQLLHLYYEGDKASGAQYSAALDETLSINFGDKQTSISVRELEEKILRDNSGVTAEYADGTYAGVYLYDLLIEKGLDQNLSDDTNLVFTGSSALSKIEISLGDLRKQSKEDGALLAFADAKTGVPLASGQGPLKLVQKGSDAQTQANLSSITVETPKAATTAKLTFKVSEENPSITVKDEYGHVMKADSSSALEYTLRADSSYTYRVTKDNFNVISDTVEFSGEDIVVNITLDPVWDGKTLTQPQKDEQGFYLIGTAAELMWWHDNYKETDRVKLTADIALNNGETNTNEWEVLGTNSGYASGGTLAFQGVFDGQGHVIRNLSIERENTYLLEVAWDGSVMAFADRISELGLFGYTAANADIKNLGVEGSIDVFDRPDSMYADWLQIGGIVGLAQGNTKISNCYANMSIKAVASLETDTVGGYPTGGYGYACDDYIGGIAGSLSGTSTITDCYTKGTYIGAETRQATIGGICGAMRYSTNSITNCYSTASFESKPLEKKTSKWYSYVGGICGNAAYNSAEATISNCFALNTSMKASGDETYVGKIAGNGTTDLFTGNYSLEDTRISGAGLVSGSGEKTLNGTTISADAAKQAASYAAWSADNWNLQDSSYPQLKWQSVSAGADKTTSYTGQADTEEGEWDGYFGSQTPPPYFNVYIQVKGHDSVLAKKFSREEMQTLAAEDNEGTLYYSAIGYGSAGRVVKEYVYLDTLLSEAGVEFSSTDTLLFGYYNYSYDYLMADRYYYPEWTNGSEEGAVKIKPVLALKSYGASSGVSKDIWDYYAIQADYLYAYMLTYGQRTPNETTYTYFTYQQTDETVNYKAELVANSTVKNLLTDALADAQIAADTCFVSSDGSDVSSAYFYTDQETKDAFVAVLDEARATLNNSASTNDNVMTAYENVQAALKKFNKVKKQGLGMDRTQLKSAIDTAKDLVDSVVIAKDGSSISESATWATRDAVDALQNSIEIAQAIYEDSGASQIEINQARSDLLEALESFVYGKGTSGVAEREQMAQELKDYVDEIDLSEYSDEAKAQIEELAQTYSKKIKQASQPYIAYDLLKEAKAAIAAVKNKVEQAREDALSSLEANYSRLDEYYDEQRSKLTGIIFKSKYDIEQATTLEEIQSIFESAQKSIDALLTKATIDNTPAKPSSVKAQNVSAKSVKVKWKADSRAKFYELYRATSVNGKYSLVTTTAKNSFKNKKLTCGKTYYYKVRAYGLSGETKIYSDYSSVAKIKAAPAKVKIKKLKAKGSKKIKIIWKKVKGASGYQVYRATSKKGKFTRIASLKSSKKKYTNAKLKSGKKYFYKVRAYTKAGGKKVFGAFSTVKKCKAK